MRSINKALLSSSAILVLTMIHHVYGAVIYSTPWRAHAVFFAGPALLVIVGAWFVYRASPAGVLRKVSKWVFILVSGIVGVVSFGFFEGGYNHFLKNVLFFGGASSQTLANLFPAPTYELPNDAVFEITGVAQFFVAVWSAYHLYYLAVEKADSSLPYGQTLPLPINSNRSGNIY